MPGFLCDVCSEWVPFDSLHPKRLHICRGFRETPKLGKFDCPRCLRVFIHPSLLKSHHCGALASYYQTSNGPKRNDAAEVTGQCYCPACARPFVSRKTIGGNNRTPAHNIVSRDALKLTSEMKDLYGVKLVNDKQFLPVGSYGSVLIVFFLLHFDGAMTSKSVPLYRTQGASLWPQVRDFLKDGGRAFLYSTGNTFPFGFGDGDRYDKDFSHAGLLDRLFGTLCQSKARRKEPEEADWDWNANSQQKAKTIFLAIDGLAPKDSYTQNYCQTGLDAQCGKCENRQGEANLLCRYFATKDAIGKQNSNNVTFTADSFDLLSFIGLQFCCDDKGDPCTSLDDVSEEWLTKVTVWQLYRHLSAIWANLKTKIFGSTQRPIAKNTPIPVILETLYHNWKAFSLFYALAYLRATAGDYDGNSGQYALGMMSNALQTKLKKADDTAANETDALNVQARRFTLKQDGGESTGGKACSLPMKSW